MAKIDKMRRFLPGLYQPSTNPNINGLLTAWADEDDRLVQAISDAKEQIFTKLAERQYLDALGSNVGVFRPAGFNRVDSLYRDLIPILSYVPKQVVPTIRKILDIFFGENNSVVEIHEINPNEIVIVIPSSVSALNRGLKGSYHWKSYQGQITAIDNVLKTLTIDMNDTGKSLVVDELALAKIGQGLQEVVCISNTAGQAGVTLQFSAVTDLSVLNTSDNFNCALPNYQGSYMPDLTATFTLTSQRGILGQSVTAGNVYPTLTMTDASNIPDGEGELMFNFGFATQEPSVKYFGRPSNTTLLLDPSYVFLDNHSVGEAVNVTVKPYSRPRTNGNDYSIYLTGVTAARLLAQDIIKTIVAAGVVIRFIVIEPEC